MHRYYEEIDTYEVDLSENQRNITIVTTDHMLASFDKNARDQAHANARLQVSGVGEIKNSTLSPKSMVAKH